MRRLRRIVLAFGRWWVRQTAVVAVLAFGAVVGWWLRKTTGPALVSESFSRTSSTAPAPPRPGPLNPRDPAVAGFLAEFASLDRPSGTLARLQADLARGRLTDFESLAKSLLSHPLPHFRREALRSVILAWGRKDPGGTFRFLTAYGAEGIELERNGRNDLVINDLKSRWAQEDPAAALEYFLRSREWTSGVDVEGVMDVLRSKPIEHLRLLGERLGEANLAALLGSSAPRFHHGSSLEWQALAAHARNSRLAAIYSAEAAMRKLSEVGPLGRDSLEEVEGWLTEFVPASLRSQIKWESISPKDASTLLPALAPADLQSGNKAVVLGMVLWNDSGAVLSFLREHGSSWIQPGALRHLGETAFRMEQDWPALVGVISEGAQRQELGLGFAANALNSHRGRGEPLEQVIDRLAVLGRDGEPAVATLLANAHSHAFPELPDLFASQSPEFQAEWRLHVVAQLARQSSPTAAEVWLRASPEELAQPGANFVTEELAARFVRRDSEAASDWIGRLPPGVGRDRAVARMIEMTVAQDPDTCGQWAATLHDPPAVARAARALGAAAPEHLSSPN